MTPKKIWLPTLVFEEFWRGNRVEKKEKERKEWFARVKQKPFHRHALHLEADHGEMIWMTPRKGKTRRLKLSYRPSSEVASLAIWRVIRMYQPLFFIFFIFYSN